MEISEHIQTTTVVKVGYVVLLDIATVACLIVKWYIAITNRSKVKDSIPAAIWKFVCQASVSCLLAVRG